MPSRVATVLTELIDERYEPGDMLPSERSMCRELGVGRTSLREALRIMSSRGLVTVQAGRGIFVAAGSDADGESWRGRDGVSAADLLQVRIFVEPLAAALAAASPMDPVEKQAMLGKQITRLADAGAALEQRVVADVEFHRTIGKIGGNPLVERVTLLDNVNSVLTDNRRVSLMAEPRRLRVLSQHREIAEAIVASEGDAAAVAMIRHLATFACDIGLGDEQFFTSVGPLGSHLATDLASLAVA
ncbi:MAG: GntR family transcriptional regulator [Solirubrobacterales bacterium]